MSQRPATRRILDQLGEDETVLSTEYTAADLKLLLPGLLIAMVIFGMMPSGWELLGFVLGTFVMVGTVGIIWYAPAHRVAHVWFLDVVNYHTRYIKGETLMLPHDSDSPPDEARTLTNIESVLPRWDSVERADGALVGAVRVQPANMALADSSDWETASDELAGFLQSISFDVQLYSTARPVDASQIVAPYRDRLDDPDVRENERLRSVIKEYREMLPSEFARRQTSVREYYMILAVEEMEVYLSDQGVLDALHDLPVVGELCEIIGVERSDLSEGDLLVLQQRELNNRLQSVRRGINELPGCRPESVSATRLTDLLEEYWTGEPVQQTDESRASQRYHGIPIVRRDSDRDPHKFRFDDTIDSQVATDGGVSTEGR